MVRLAVRPMSQTLRRSIKIAINNMHKRTHVSRTVTRSNLLYIRIASRRVAETGSLHRKGAQ